jgi:predicted enzyme related to lactoylglutathione lyase
MLKKLRSAIYQVSNLQEATAWYINITGMQPYFNESFYVGFNIDGFELGLHPGEAAVPKGQAVAYWKVDDIEAAVKKMTDAGAVIIEPLSDVGGGTKVASVKDPWGNAIGLIEEAN